MQEKSMTRNHGGGIIGIEIIEKESSRGEASRTEASGRHLGCIWEASGKHLGCIWKASGKHLGDIWGGIWEAFGVVEAKEASGRHLEGRSHKT